MKLKNILTIIVILLILVVLGSVYWLKINKIPKEDFEAPTKNWSSQKKVDDYFKEKLNFIEKDF